MVECWWGPLHKGISQQNINLLLLEIKGFVTKYWLHNTKEYTMWFWCQEDVTGKWNLRLSEINICAHERNWLSVRLNALETKWLWIHFDVPHHSWRLSIPVHWEAVGLVSHSTSQCISAMGVVATQKYQLTGVNSRRSTTQAGQINKKTSYKSHPDFEKLLGNFFNQVSGISRDLYLSNYGNVN